MKVLYQFFAAWRRWHRRRVAIRELMALPNWVLKDIGVLRAEIPAVVEAQLATLDAAAPTVPAGADTPKTEPTTQGANKAAATA
ncbi:MAG: DUF1127 domain-containing protein [Acidiferrobacterales bacterium]